MPVSGMLLTQSERVYSSASEELGCFRVELIKGRWIMFTRLMAAVVGMVLALPVSGVAFATLDTE